MKNAPHRTRQPPFAPRPGPSNGQGSEMAYAGDLKFSGAEAPCEFESRPRHHYSKQHKLTDFQQMRRQDQMIYLCTAVQETRAFTTEFGMTLGSRLRVRSSSSERRRIPASTASSSTSPRLSGL